MSPPHNYLFMLAHSFVFSYICNMAKRDYKAEYKKFQSSTKAKKDRAARNKASRNKNCATGKEVHHKDGNPRNNSASNCVCISVSANRGKREKSRLKGSKRA